MPLRSLGAQIEYTENEGYPPLKDYGKGTGRTFTLPSGKCQFAIYLGLADDRTDAGTRLEPGTGRRNYFTPLHQPDAESDERFGAKAEWTSDHTLQVAPQPYHPVPYYVESDWSAASYWYEIVALSKHEAVVTLPGLFAQSPQGDAKVAELFEQLGICTQREGNSVTLKKTHPHTDRMEYNFVNQPDLAQTFVVTCAMLGIPFRFSGLQSL